MTLLTVSFYLLLFFLDLTIVFAAKLAQGNLEDIKEKMNPLEWMILKDLKETKKNKYKIN